MRLHKYSVQTYCLVAVAEEGDNPGAGTNDGDIITIGSRDKYYFAVSHRTSCAELYLFRYDGGRTTKVDQNEYVLRIFELESCGDSANIYLQTGDIILGISSREIGGFNEIESSGCSPYLYILRPIFQRKSNTIKNPQNLRTC